MAKWFQAAAWSLGHEVEHEIKAAWRGAFVKADVPVEDEVRAFIDCTVNTMAGLTSPNNAGITIEKVPRAAPTNGTCEQHQPRGVFLAMK